MYYDSDVRMTTLYIAEFFVYFTIIDLMLECYDIFIIIRKSISKWHTISISILHEMHEMK